MEKVPRHVTPYNLNIRQSSGVLTEMTFEELSRTVFDHLPMNFQFGGFARDFAEFLSFGKKPYLRSFQTQWPTRKVTIIGWPFKETESGRSFADKTLFNLRTNLRQRCSIEHKYPPPKYEDNDLFMVLGDLVDMENVTESEFLEVKGAVTTAVESTVRDYLAANPIEVTVSKSQVFVARYTDQTLCLDSTNVYCMDHPSIDGPFIRRLY